ncbi:uncharacterized protein LOC124881023 [Girardinichthys multiradiatus]|uniref:uncharacterized protein LOC124881023 n=1 Tax=Girardinichthys multiradiatus TaxID=208333 RepID=UPI001FACEA3A|nr:uncharacterized protein LOC124881023 [Girardinichthys multiradiatus]
MRRNEQAGKRAYMEGLVQQVFSKNHRCSIGNWVIHNKFIMNTAARQRNVLASEEKRVEILAKQERSFTDPETQTNDPPSATMKEAKKSLGSFFKTAPLPASSFVDLRIPGDRRRSAAPVCKFASGRWLIASLNAGTSMLLDFVLQNVLCLYLFLDLFLDLYHAPCLVFVDNKLHYQNRLSLPRDFTHTSLRPWSSVNPRIPARQGGPVPEKVFLPWPRSFTWISLTRWDRQVKLISEKRPLVRQYPLKPEAEEGIKPVIQDMLKSGILREAPDATCNTPIFPVQKVSTGKWRMVQDLRPINEIVEHVAPDVPNPHTLLHSLTPDKKYFSVVDLSNAFFTVPLHEESQHLFGFQFKGKKYTYTRLPQGFSKSPYVYTQALRYSMSTCEVPEHSQVLLYVDDILIASDTQQHCEEATITVLKHLHQTGHKASTDKLQFCKEKVIYLGHMLSQHGRSLLSSRKTAILEALNHELNNK